jgi:hypothetical protein
MMLLGREIVPSWHYGVMDISDEAARLLDDLEFGIALKN